ncbi:MAG: hypothetical protein K0S09_1247 [Sphingobacteriaceae bacterium]|jgi:hypothetical protein|nr:hypothetical protein [Sphingobacteriaceae bacterium]
MLIEVNYGVGFRMDFKNQKILLKLSLRLRNK